MENRKKCYISVPMEGRTMDEIEAAIDDADYRLWKKGYNAVSPIDDDVNPDLTQPLPVLMGNDIRALLECEAFTYIGKDEELKDHKGCSAEVATAMIYEKEIVRL